MKRIGLAAGFLGVLTACGQSGAATSPASPSPIAASPSKTPTQTKPEILFAVLEMHLPAGATSDSWPNDTVAIVGLDGVARAKAQFAPRAIPNVGMRPPILQPEARVAGDAVFYADGRGVIWVLRTSGRFEPVATFPIDKPSQQELAFAVSPDGRRLLASILTVEKPGQGISPVNLAVMSAPAGGSSVTLSRKHITWPDGTSPAVMAMVGWDAVGPLASVDTPLTTLEVGRQWYGHVARIDSSGNPGQIIGGPDCDAASGLKDGTIVCFAQHDVFSGERRSMSVRRSDGSVLSSPPTLEPGYAYANPVLSPNGQRIAFSRLYASPYPQSAGVITRDGRTIVLPNSFMVQGWLDDSTIIGETVRNDQQRTWDENRGNMAVVRLSAPEKLEDLGFKGSFVGVLND